MLLFPSTKSNLVTQYHHENNEEDKENREEKRKKEGRGDERGLISLFFFDTFFFFRSLQNLLKILSTLSPIITTKFEYLIKLLNNKIES
jgi:hypothetical protein